MRMPPDVTKSGQREFKFLIGNKKKRGTLFISHGIHAHVPLNPKNIRPAPMGGRLVTQDVKLRRISPWLYLRPYAPKH